MSRDPFDEPLGAGFGGDHPADLDDPFAEPIVDTVTGEILDDEPAGDAAPVAAPPAALAAVALEAVASGPGILAGMRKALDERLVEQYAAIVARRPAGKVTPETVQPELAWLADAHDVIAGIGAVFADAVVGIKQIASGVTIEATGKEVDKTGGSTSVRVGASGQGLKVTTTQPTEAFANDDEIIDVLVAADLESHLALGRITEDEAAVFAAGIRSGISAYRNLVSPPSWKTSSLDRLREQLGASGETGVALAGRLAAAYGRRVKGGSQPTTKIERVEITRKV